MGRKRCRLKDGWLYKPPARITPTGKAVREMQLPPQNRQNQKLSGFKKKKSLK